MGENIELILNALIALGVGVLLTMLIFQYMRRMKR